MCIYYYDEIMRLVSRKFLLVKNNLTFINNYRHVTIDTPPPEVYHESEEFLKKECQKQREKGMGKMTMREFAASLEQTPSSYKYGRLTAKGIEIPGSSVPMVAFFSPEICSQMDGAASICEHMSAR